MGKFAKSSYEIIEKHKVIKRKVLKVVLVAFILTLALLGGQHLALDIKSRALGYTGKFKPLEAQILPYTPSTIQEHICAATNGENCDVIYNLCKKESGTWLTSEPPCQKYSVNKNTNGTFDYSYLQINDVHIIGRPASKGKGTITMDCVYDLYCASRWANEKIKKEQGHIWVAWDKI